MSAVEIKQAIPELADHPFDASKLAHNRCHVIPAKALSRLASEQVFADIKRSELYALNSVLCPSI